MSRIVINGDVVLKRNNATDAQGVAIPPTVESMNYGEIAINYNAKDACIFIKALDAAGQQKIVKFVGEEVIAKTLGDILGESAADLATLKEMIKLFEGSSSDVLTLVKNLQTEVALKANKTYVDSELTKKLGKTETAADSSKLGGRPYGHFWHQENAGSTAFDWGAKNLSLNGSISGCKSIVSNQTNGYFIGDAASGLGTGNTGGLFYAYGNNPLLFYTNSNRRMKITGSGFVLIGTDKEDAMLHLSSDIMNKYAAIFRNTNSTKDGSFGLVVDGGTSANDRCARFRNWAGTDLMQVAGNGDVFIGDASSDGAHKLIIKGSTKSTYFRFASRTDSFDSAGYIGCGSTLDDTIYLTSLTDINIGSGGNLGTIIIPKSDEISLNRQTRVRAEQCTFSIVDSRHAEDNNVLDGTVHCQLLFKKHTGAQIGGGIQLIQEGNKNLYAGGMAFITNQGSGLSEKMRILGNGNVCIGNNNGTEKLTVTGNIFSTGHNTVGNNSSFRINSSTGQSSRVLVLDSNDDIYIGGVDSNSKNITIRHKGVNAIQFTGSYPVENTIRVQNGYVGFGGVLNPNNRIHVNGTIQSDNGCFFRSELSGFSWNNGNGVVTTYIADNSNQTPLLLAARSSGDRLFAAEFLNTGGELRFSFNSTTRFMFTADGKLGINKTGYRPTQALDVGGNGLFSGNLVVKGETYTYSADGIETFEAGGGATRLADLTDVDLSGAQGNFVLYQSTETNANGDRIWKARSDAKTWSDISGKPTTFTPVEHSHIGSTYVTTPSDRALKTDLKRIDLATNTILSLTPYTYNWTTQAIETFGFKNHHAAGVIAQEIESILPFAVQPLNDEFKAVDYIQIIPYLIAAFQELHTALQDKNIAIANATKEYKRMYGANEKLAKRVSDLESELINLKNQIAA